MRERVEERGKSYWKPKSHASPQIDFDDLFTIFVDGLPAAIDAARLRFICKDFGMVIDSFIPYKKRTYTSYKFGFIRYRSKEEAIRAIHVLDGARRFGSFLSVKMAFCRRIQAGRSNANRRDAEVCYAKKETNDFGLKLKDTNEDSVDQNTQIPSTPNRCIQVESSNRDWLNRCLIGRLPNVAMCKTIGDIICSEGVLCLDVKLLAGPFVLLICQEQEDLESLLENNASWLRNWFTDIKPWSSDFQSDFRLAWLSCVGIPLHTWDSDTFRKIGGLWGEFIETDDGTRLEKRFDRARILISTNHSCLINETIDMVANNLLHRVRVLEEPVIETRFSEDFKSKKQSVESSEKEDSSLPDDELEEFMQSTEFQEENGKDQTKEKGQGEDEELNTNIGEGINRVDSKGIHSHNHNDISNDNESTSLKNVSANSISSPFLEVKARSSSSKTVEQAVNASPEEETNSSKSGDERLESPKGYCEPIVDEVSVVNETLEDSTIVRLKEASTDTNIQCLGLNQVENETRNEADVLEIATNKINGRRKQRKKKDIWEIMGPTMIKEDRIGKKAKLKTKVSKVAVKKMEVVIDTESISDGDIRRRNEAIIEEAKKTIEIGKLCGLNIIGDENDIINRLIDIETREMEQWNNGNVSPRA